MVYVKALNSTKIYIQIHLYIDEQMKKIPRYSLICHSTNTVHHYIQIISLAFAHKIQKKKNNN